MRFFPKNAATRSVSEDSSLADEKILHRCNELLFRENGNRRRCTETFHRKPFIIFFQKRRRKAALRNFFCEKANFFFRSEWKFKKCLFTFETQQVERETNETDSDLHFISFRLSHSLTHSLAPHTHTHSLTLSRLTRTLPPSRLWRFRYYFFQKRSFFLLW